MNRRQFFRTVAATAASVVAVGVAPRVVAKRVPFKPNPAQAVILDKFPGYVLIHSVAQKPQKWYFSRVHKSWAEYEIEETKTR